MRGALVDNCWNCGTVLRRASPEQHAALQAPLEDISLQLLWPTPAFLKKYPNAGKAALHGVNWWWQMLIQAYDRLKRAEDFEMAPALDGIGFDGRGYDFVRGARLRRALNDHEIGEIIEYVRAFGVEHGVRFREFKEKRAA